MIRAKGKDTVKVRYTGRLSDGTIFDRSPEERPLHFILGRQEVIAGFDEAVEGMYRGERKTVTIGCEKAYGTSNPDLVEKIDRSLIDKDITLQVGAQLEVTNHDGSVFHVMIRELTADEITLDANHPLAGQELTFDIELLDVVKNQSPT